jgi:DNA adenine methylase
MKPQTRRHKLSAKTEFILSADTKKVPFKGQLLKWIGNKQKHAKEIVQRFPARYGTYFEPFLGSGAVMARLAPASGVGSDTFGPLIEIWQALKEDPAKLKRWYAERYEIISNCSKVDAYERVKASYNRAANAADLLFLSRACYGGVVRFRKADGYMSTPCGIHDPISPESFNQRVDAWAPRVTGVRFASCDYRDAFTQAVYGDLIYCDPPYTHTQAIIYGAQAFRLPELLDCIAEAKARGVRVVLSIDGTKKSGEDCALPIPAGLFEREEFLDCGTSMLKRFQLINETGEDHCVSDRLLLTW